MNRRNFLQAGAACAMAPVVMAQDPGQDAEPPPVIMTVKGPINPNLLGITLPHEHVMVDFIGADKVSPDRYNADEVARVVLPHLERVKKLGCASIMECTPSYLGRDVALLKRLSELSGLHFITNTGYYGANGGKHLPAHFAKETAEQTATRWIKEWADGIGTTGIRPGFIKIGVDAGPLNPAAKKLVVAAALTHKATGLTIVSHTGNGFAAVEQLTLIAAEEVSPEAFVWVHAQNQQGTQAQVSATGLHAWVEFDGIRENNIKAYVDTIKEMKAAGFLSRVLISQDAGWYHVGEANGGAFQPYEVLFSAFLPALKAAGFSAEEIRLLIADNPRDAFTIRKRPAF